MAHAQKPDFVFRRNGRVYLNGQGASVQSTTGSRDVRISNMFRGSVKGTGCLLHSPVSPSLPLPCVTVCHHISTGLYYSRQFSQNRNNLSDRYSDAVNTQRSTRYQKCVVYQKMLVSAFQTLHFVHTSHLCF